jgi:hypothetical protein
VLATSQPQFGCQVLTLAIKAAGSWISTVFDAIIACDTKSAHGFKTATRAEVPGVPAKVCMSAGDRVRQRAFNIEKAHQLEALPIASTCRRVRLRWFPTLRSSRFAAFSEVAERMRPPHTRHGYDDDLTGCLSQSLRLKSELHLVKGSIAARLLL